MNVKDVIAAKVSRNGISIAELARRTHIQPELLRRSINGNRPIKGDELVPLCIELDLQISDFNTEAAPAPT